MEGSGKVSDGLELEIEFHRGLQDQDFVSLSGFLVSPG